MRSADNMFLQKENTLTEKIVKALEDVSANPAGKSKWTKNDFFYDIKKSATTTKGAFGEEVFQHLLQSPEAKSLGFVDCELIDEGRGDFDHLVLHKTYGPIRVECKLATLDTNEGFQFNGIRKNREYDFVYCLGVSPWSMHHGVLAKSFCQELTTLMEKNNRDGFKWSAKPKNLELFRDFKSELGGNNDLSFLRGFLKLIQEIKKGS